MAFNITTTDKKRDSKRINITLSIDQAATLLEFSKRKGVSPTTYAKIAFIEQLYRDKQLYPSEIAPMNKEDPANLSIFGLDLTPKVLFCKIHKLYENNWWYGATFECSHCNKQYLISDLLQMMFGKKCTCGKTLTPLSPSQSNMSNHTLVPLCVHCIKNKYRLQTKKETDERNWNEHH